MSGYRTLAAGAALIASVLAVVAVALFEGFLSPSVVGNLTADEYGVFAALAVVVAIVAYAQGSD